jgi:hypothetical protein
MVDRSPLLRRTRITIVTAATALAVAGCGTTGDTVTATPQTPGQVSTSPAATASGEPPASASAGAAPTIPASAFFEVPTNMRRDRGQAEGDTAVPELCDGELAPGDGVLASAAMMSSYKQPDAPADAVPHGVLYQTIRSYGGDGAAAFMDRARDGLADCTTYRQGESTVTVRSKPLSGVADEALTIDLVRPQLDLPGDPTGGEQTNRLVVMRFGTVVTVLHDGEYERSSSVPKLVDTFTREAAKAVRAWRG